MRWVAGRILLTLSPNASAGLVGVVGPNHWPASSPSLSSLWYSSQKLGPSTQVRSLRTYISFFIEKKLLVEKNKHWFALRSCMAPPAWPGVTPKQETKIKQTFAFSFLKFVLMFLSLYSVEVPLQPVPSRTRYLALQPADKDSDGQEMA